MSSHDSARLTRRKYFFAILLTVSFAMVFIALVLPVIAPATNPSIQVGSVAQQDYQAPRAISFQSSLLTEEQRKAASLTVPAIYTSPDTSVARSQLDRLRAALAFISSVRADAYARPEQKIADLAGLEDIRMNQELSTNILALSENRWQSVQQEAIVVLEQVMRNTIREDRLEEARRMLPALVSLSLTEDQAVIVARLVEAFVAPNSFYSEELTEAARQKAYLSVGPVTRSFKAGETIVQRGSVIQPVDLEALQELGLAQPQYGWKDFISAAAISLLLVAFTSLYIRNNTGLIDDTRALSLVLLLFLAFLFTSRLLIPGHTLIPYIFPLAAYGMIVSVLIGMETALITSLILSLLTSYGLPFALDLAAYYTLSSFFGIIALGRARRMTSFLFAGAAVAFSGALTAIAFRLPEPATDLMGIASISGAALLNGSASAGFTILTQFFLAQMLGLTTAIQLMEISRPDHPLLQFMLRNAPGSYQHSLQVANLAEQAAENIGADPLLTRVGALYHDVGKAKNPAFFIENQVLGNTNPHNELDPIVSARTILQHVLDGIELTRKYRLPKRIQDFVLEHHGTMIARYQYANAVKAAGGNENQVNIELFRYPGPKPRSKETAILMLADGCEARVRAERPQDEESLREIIRSVIDHRLAQGELDESNLTIKDLADLVDSFAATLRGIYHPRIEYPKLEKKEIPSGNIKPPLPATTAPASEGQKPETKKQAAT